MKSIIYLAIICAALHLSQAITPEQRKEFEVKLHKECGAKEGASDDDLIELKQHQIPTNPKAKCFSACAFETIGIVKDNAVSVEGTAAMAKMAFDNDEAKVGMLTQIAEDCKDVKHSNRCDLAVKIMECVLASANSRNIDLSEVV